MRKTYIFLAVLLLAGSAMLFGYWPGQAPSLFSDRKVKAPDGYELPHDVRQYRFVEITPKMLDGVSDNLGFARIKLFGKEELTLEFEEREQDDGEAKITYGSVVGIPNSQVLMSRFGEAMSALVWLPDGRSHQIVYAGGNVHLLYEKDSRFQMKCEVAGIATNNAALPTAIKDASGKEVPVAYQTVIACNLEGGSAAERMDARQPSRGQYQASSAPSEAKGFGGSILSFMGDVQRWASKPRSTQHANRKKNMSRVVGKDKVGVNAIDILVLFTDRAMNAAGGGDGLVAYYPFNGNANDESGNTNSAVAVGATLATNRFGVAASSYSFAAGTYVQTMNSNGFPIGMNDFSVSVWLNLSQLVANEYQIIFTNGSLDQFQMSLRPFVGSDSQLEFYTGGGGSVADFQSPSLQWVVNHWYNLQMVRYQNSLSVYRDGVLIGQSAITQGNNATGSSRNLDFGFRTSNNNHPLYGQLDDIRIYNRALSTSEVAQLYASESTGPALTFLFGEAAAKSRAGQLVAHMRDSIARSDVTNIKINYTSARYTVETAANNSMAAEIAVLTATDTILALRDKVRADLVTLLVSNTDPQVVGIAQVSGAYSVIQIGVAGTFFSSHELGHNFGCLHGYDRVEVPPDPSINPPSGAATFSSTNIPFPYGWNFTNNAGSKHHTIMSYGWTGGGSTQIPYFSNPDVYYQGGQTGMLTNAHPMGYGANNAMQLRNQAPMTAKYK